MHKYTFRIISSHEEWEQIATTWNPLLEASEFNDIFLTYEWLRTWWNYFGNGKLSILLIEHSGKIISISPLYVRRWGILKVLMFIGNDASDYGGFLLDKTYDYTEIFSLAFNYICTHIKFDVIDLHQICDRSPLFSFLEKYSAHIFQSRLFNMRFYETDR